MFFSCTLHPSKNRGKLTARCKNESLTVENELECVLDQRQVSEDKRSGIRSDPNRPDDEEYIVRLVGQVVHVSLETVRIVSALPERYTA